ncbi:MAG: hypothetical protein GF355_13705 [Candidatus Eisenbacteria bacterium]|nr:hypothetical protein [Candidatus Eisenbacteria bacterium]
MVGNKKDSFYRLQAKGRTDIMRLVLAVFGLAVLVGTAGATIPDAGLCSVDPLDEIGGMLVCPDPPAAFAEFTVNVRNGDNEPIPDAFVELVFGVPGNHTFCASAVLTGTTDAMGNVTFNVTAGGCTEAADAVRIVANSVEIRSYDFVKSPDFDGASDGEVVLSDFIVFGGAYSTGAGGCHDYDANGSTELPDFIVFGQGWGHACQ